MSAQVDAIVTSVNQVGFFADAGPLPLFVSAHVSSAGPKDLTVANTDAAHPI